MFVPSILTVMMSWLSFWINIESVPARINLGLLTVVTITYQSTGVNASLPRVANAGIPRRRHRHRLAKHGYNLTSDTRCFLARILARK